jgi:CheY-like chemotaxis protein
MYRILVVEDDEVIAKTIRQHLQSWNYEVFAVADFNSVMEEFARVKPHLVLMGYKASVSQWILLVHGDPESIKAADDICLFDE